MTERGDQKAPRRTEREPYVPPQIQRIQLSVDEALMSICKAGVISGPLGLGCADLNGPCMGGGS